jgi:hypothetical protein
MAGSRHGPKHQGADGFYDEHRHWRTFPELLPDDERVMPQTVPNEYIVTHRLGCECTPCTTYPNPRALRASKIRYAARHRE